MRTAGVILCLVVVAATASRVLGDELTADQVVDRMLAANRAWLRAEVDSVSYVLTKHNYGQTIKGTVTSRWIAMGGIMAALLVLIFVFQKRKDVV